MSDIENETAYHHNTKIKEIYENTNIEELLEFSKRIIIAKSEDFMDLGSGWIFNRIDYLILKIDEFEPISGGTYKTLPKRIKSKKAVITIKNYDEKCFMWCVLRFFLLF